MKELTSQSKVILKNGIAIPPLGLGVWKMADGAETQDAVVSALELGYRLIDSAKYYGNEASVGRAVRHFTASGKALREDLFVTTKLWPTDFLSPEKAFMRSLELLDLDYIDLYLIHWPSPVMPKNVWKTLEHMYEQKLVRSIGISNYSERDIEKLLAYANIPPAVNQIKFSVFDHDLELLNYCKQNSIVIEAYSPLERGHIDHPVIQRIAAAYNKSPAQIMLRWCLEHGTIPLPKSSHPTRQRENLDFFDFQLSPNEMEELNALG